MLGARDLFIGVNVLDASGYPDCRPEFIAAFERLANLATRAGVEGAPLPHPHAADRVDEGGDHQARHLARRRLRLTWSCYEPGPDGLSCGLCDACQLRQKGFAEAGLPDPLPYSR